MEVITSGPTRDDGRPRFGWDGVKLDEKRDDDPRLGVEGGEGRG
jgi:hypothetical protein